MQSMLLCRKKKRKDYAFNVNLMRSQVLYWAAQCYFAPLVVVCVVMHCISFEGRLLNNEHQVQTNSNALCLNVCECV
jgi:hypothetical protein